MWTVSWIFVGLLSFSFLIRASQSFYHEIDFPDYERRLPICNVHKFVQKSGKNVTWSYCGLLSSNETVCKIRCNESGEVFETPSTGEFKCTLEGVWTPDTIPNCVKQEQGAPPLSSVPLPTTAPPPTSVPPRTSVPPPFPVVCLRNQFLCSDNETCIGIRHRCNNASDCKDSSDEAGCQDRECPEGDRRCGDGIMCVPKSFFCDGSKDCTDGSDENDCDKCVNWGCSYQCEDTSQGPRCSCDELFELDPTDKRTCKNKCEKLGCSQTCSETSDGLQCSCHHGFRLDPQDKRTCKRCSTYKEKCETKDDCCDNTHNCVDKLVFKDYGKCSRKNW